MITSIEMLSLDAHPSGTRPKKTTMITNCKQGEEQEKEWEPEQQYDIQRGNTTKTGNNKKDKKTKETKKTTRTNSKEEVNTNILTAAVNGHKENQHNKEDGRTNEKQNNNNDKNMNREEDNDKNKNNDTNEKNAEEKNSKNSNNGNNNNTRVNIITPGEMATYTFTVSWRPDTKVGQDGKIIIRMPMREMVHRTPSIIFHPTNSASSPVPRDINNINRTPAMVPLAAPLFGLYYSRGHISLKNWT
jgi:hypothetical protein